MWVGPFDMGLEGAEACGGSGGERAGVADGAGATEGGGRGRGEVDIGDDGEGMGEEGEWQRGRRRMGGRIGVGGDDI